VRFPVGSRVEFLGADDPGAHVWRGQPGVVVHNPGFVPSETNVFGQAIR
jgi:hypothetical protein